MTHTEHISLSKLQAMVSRALDGAFPMPLWVAAEISEMKVNAAGHCYMELVEKGAPGSGSGSGSGAALPRAQARAVAWRSKWAALSAYFRGTTGEGLAAGMKVLLRVVVSYHELYGFSLHIVDIDPSYTLGENERLRLETIARLHSDGVWDMNRSAGLPPVPQRVAVISSSGAAGWRDFVQELSRYPFRFEVELFDAVMQGAASEQTVVAALERIADRACEFDVVAIVRGGGSASDLAAFDSYRLSSHVAQFPLPVITGIGHDKDRSVTDMVAALELKTPTAVAVWLGESLEAFSRTLDTLAEAIVEVSVGASRRERERLERAARMVSAGAVEMTRRLEVRLTRLAGETARLSGERILCERHRLGALAAYAEERPGMILARAAERLGAMERAVELSRPENILALGFAIVRTATTDGSPGRAVVDARSLAEGQLLDITLARGKVKAKSLK